MQTRFHLPSIDTIVFATGAIMLFVAVTATTINAVRGTHAAQAAQVVVTDQAGV